MAYSRIRFEIQNSATMTLVYSVVLQQKLFHLRDDHVVDDLQQMNAQHELKIIRLAAAAARNEVVRTDQLNQL